MAAYKFLMAFLLSVSLVGIAWGDETLEEVKYIYHMDQRIDGNGFFSSYQNISAGNLRLDKMGHGIGDYEYESTLYSQNRAKYDSASRDYTLLDERTIDFNETAAFVYLPASFNLGNSFRSGAFRSLGKDYIAIKNYNISAKEYMNPFIPGGVSMNALLDSASSFKKDLSAHLFFRWTESGGPSEIDYEALDARAGFTRLNVSTSFTGIGHFGALELNKSVHEVRNLIDEDYVGTFTIEKKMSHSFIYEKKLEVDEWLPCCSGSYSEMPLYYRLGGKAFGSNVTAIFDCTCFRAPVSIGPSA